MFSLSWFEISIICNPNKFKRKILTVDGLFYFHHPRSDEWTQNYSGNIRSSSFKDAARQKEDNFWSFSLSPSRARMVYTTLHPEPRPKANQS